MHIDSWLQESSSNRLFTPQSTSHLAGSSRSATNRWVAMARLILIALAVLVPLLALFEANLPSFFAFKPAKLQQLGQQSIAKHGDDIESLMRDLVDRLQIEYPGLVQDFGPERWVFNVAGGATGAMMILHASITEYLILFGSASGTEGHSGAHFAHDYFTIIAGRQTAGFLGEVKPRVYLPGDQHHHPRFNTAHYTLDNSSWALELAQGKRIRLREGPTRLLFAGYIPAMMPFGLIQMPLSLDLDSTWRTIYYTGQSIVNNLLRGKV